MCGKTVRGKSPPTARENACAADPAAQPRTGGLGSSLVASRGGSTRSLTCELKVAARNADSSGGLKAPRGRRSPRVFELGDTRGERGSSGVGCGSAQWRHGSGESRPATTKVPEHTSPNPLPSVHPSRGEPGGVSLSIGVWPVAGVGCRGPQEPPEATQRVGVLGLRRNARGARMRVGLARLNPKNAPRAVVPQKVRPPAFTRRPCEAPANFQWNGGSPARSGNANVTVGR